MNMENMKTLTQSIEDYLEAIYILAPNGSVKSIDVAARLNVSKPAVNKAMNELKERGLVQKQSYGKIVLTDEGRAIADNVFGRHKLIREFLVKIGVSEKTSEIDCCKIEHVLSRETIDCLKKHLETL